MGFCFSYIMCFIIFLLYIQLKTFTSPSFLSSVMFYSHNLSKKLKIIPKRGKRARPWLLKGCWKEQKKVLRKDTESKRGSSLLASWCVCPQFRSRGACAHRQVPPSIRSQYLAVHLQLTARIQLRFGFAWGPSTRLVWFALDESPAEAVSVRFSSISDGKIGSGRKLAFLFVFDG